MSLQLTQEEDRFFIKTFLLDGTRNLNNWAVTKEAMRQDLTTFLDKPIVLTKDFGHPQAVSGDALFKEQEKFRVGKILEVGIDHNSGKAWARAEITDPKAKELLKGEAVSFVSPSIVFTAQDLKVIDGVEVAVKFEGAHLAIVKDPAYSIQKAQIKGKCAGSEGTCKKTLQKVEAKIRNADIGPVCVKEKGEPCKLSSNKDNNKKYDSMTEEEDREKEDSNEEELEEKRKEESKKAEEDEEKKEEESKKGKKADEDEDEPLDAEEDEDEKEDSKKALKKALRRIAHLEAEANAEKDVFIKEIVEARLSKGYIKEAEEDAEIKKLKGFGLIDLKALSADTKADKNSKRPYSVLQYNEASVGTKSSDSFLKFTGGGRN